MTNKTKEKVWKWLEQLAMNYLLKRGYEITMPKIYFSAGGYSVWGSAKYWQQKSSPTKEGKGERA